jgi:hypothetical protein
MFIAAKNFLTRHLAGQAFGSAKLRLFQGGRTELTSPKSFSRGLQFSDLEKSDDFRAGEIPAELSLPTVLLKRVWWAQNLGTNLLKFA